MIKWIWWDFDGTIYRFPPAYEELKNKRRLELFSQITGKPENEETWEEYKKLYKKYQSHSAVFISLGKPKNFWRSDLTHNLNVLPFLKPDKRTIAAFQDFSKMPINHAIFTNNTFSEVKQILHFLKINILLFKHILTIDESEEPKPDLSVFKKMLGLSQVNANEVLAVGDRVGTDLEPAHKLGMKTCLVWSADKPQWIDYVFPHVADVVKIFKD